MAEVGTAAPKGRYVGEVGTAALPGDLAQREVERFWSPGGRLAASRRQPAGAR